MPKEDTQFKKGQSGNPNGRPKVIGKVQELAREKTETAINKLVQVLEDEDANPAAIVAAANAILDRGWGKPVQHNVNEDVTKSNEWLDIISDAEKQKDESRVH